MSGGTALYFPSIDIRDGGWLKRSLLYWERIRRIVPSGVTPNDVGVVRTFDQSGLLLNTPPDAYRDVAADRFRSCWSDSLREVVKERDAEIERRLPNEPWLIHPDKLGRMLHEDLESCGAKSTPDGWLQVNSRFAGAYMHALATVMSTRLEAPMVTDTVFDLAVGERIAYAGALRTQDTDNTTIPVMLDLKIEVAAPKFLGSVSADAILKFREKFATERRAFREAVEAIRTTAAGMTDPLAVADFLNTKRDEIRSVTAEQRRSMRDLAEDCATHWWDIVSPTLVCATTGQMLPTDLPLGTIFGPAGFLFGLRRWYKDYQARERDINRANPWHYIHLIRKNIA